jgi:hypothetical protein
MLVPDDYTEPLIMHKYGAACSLKSPVMRPFKKDQQGNLCEIADNQLGTTKRAESRIERTWCRRGDQHLGRECGAASEEADT